LRNARATMAFASRTRLVCSDSFDISNALLSSWRKRQYDGTLNRGQNPAASA
jgi:hypothetical protein